MNNLSTDILFQNEFNLLQDRKYIAINAKVYTEIVDCTIVKYEQLNWILKETINKTDKINYN